MEEGTSSSHTARLLAAEGVRLTQRADRGNVGKQGDHLTGMPMNRRRSLSENGDGSSREDLAGTRTTTFSSENVQLKDAPRLSTPVESDAAELHVVDHLSRTQLNPLVPSHKDSAMTSQGAKMVAQRGGKTRKREEPWVVGQNGECRADTTMMTSEDDEPATITYVIEEAGTVKTMNRLSLDLGKDEHDGDVGKRPVATAHCHVDPKETGMDKKARFKLMLASLLCMVFMIGECVGGVLAHSLAVVSDAAHLLTDFASFMISLMALYLASRPATKRLSFGWHRAEILGALVSILMLWVITGVLAYSAVLRVQSGDYEIDAKIMLITSATGVFFNVILGCTLHQHGHSHGSSHSHGHSHGHGHSHSQPSHHSPSSSPCPSPALSQHTSLLMEEADQSPLINHSSSRGRGYGSLSHGGAENSGTGVSRTPHGQGQDEAEVKERYREGHNDDARKRRELTSSSIKKKKVSNINVKAAFIHVLGDFCQSVGVLIAAFIIYFKPEWKIADPICTFLFSVLVLITTINILRDILVVLMEGTPRNINFEEVRDSILDMEGVKDLHDLRVWSLTMDKTALSVHLAVERGMDPMQVVQATSRLIQHKYNITQTTIQVEEFVEEMRDCSRCQHLKD